MAVDVTVHRTSPKRPIGPLGQLLQRIIFYTADVPLQPRGYVQGALVQGQSTYLRNICRDGQVPAGATVVVINVEGGSLRYSDSEQTSSTFGELYTAGTTISRVLDDLGSISLCSPDPACKVNVSFYAVVR